MATSTTLDKQVCSGKRERADGDSRSDGKEQDASTPAIQRRGVVEKAMEDPGLLTPKELDCLVRVLCAKVARQPGTAKPIADFCITVSSRPRGKAFGDLLMTSIHQWFDRQDELLPRRLPRAGDHLERKAEGEPRFKWTAFVDFLAELVAAMSGAGWNIPGHNSLWRLHDLAMLLRGCWDIMLRDPVYDVLDELKCLQSSFLVAGKTVHSFAARSVEDLVDLMRGESKNPKFPPEAQKILLELIKLQASAWEIKEE
ncbi:hypothetical protein HPB48_005075 [Haemaphysalis longicornis]|uniref:MIF4G domain-containing protein n=1 Tax=Haemaphysalis longicornis TaxID=44386 RepID=A0A9J6FIR0_HAELO|nr:hypothetical protein HPB48_005075 [Haemaphysalis longicornis]